MAEKRPVIDQNTIEKYLTWLREQERSQATLQKYTHDLNAISDFLKEAVLTNWCGQRR